jgi:hypothetical protein
MVLYFTSYVVFMRFWLGSFLIIGPIPWLHPTDMTLLIVFFSEFVKYIVYYEKVQLIHKLLDRILRAALCITNEMLASIW